MKNNISSLLFGFLAFLLVGSCKKDYSTLDTNKLPNITIDTVGQGSLSVLQFDRIKIDPKLKGVESDLSYVWSINPTPRSKEFMVIGEEKVLNYTVSFAPTMPNEVHKILLLVKDKKTGLEYVFDWPMVIKNAIGEGLVVVETYDGINTDISHIMSPLVTPDYQVEKVRYQVYSSVNDAEIPGLVKHMAFTRVGANNVLLTATSESMMTIKTLDYVVDQKNEDFFYAPEASYGPSFLLSSIQNEVMVKGGKLFANWLQISKFGLPFNNQYVIPSVIAVNNRYDSPNIILNFYSEEQGSFIYQSSLSSFGDRVMKPVPASTTGPFNPASVPNKINIAAGVKENADFVHILKDKTSGAFGVYILDGGGWDTEDYFVIPSKPARFVDVSAAPEIAQAQHFIIMPDQNVILYATETKIHAIIYGGTSANYGLRYETTGGEKITSFSLYQQADYPKRNPQWDGGYFSKNNKQLIVGTYLGVEGKVNIMPLINEGVANIDKANIHTIGGFGKILLTRTQL